MLKITKRGLVLTAVAALMLLAGRGPVGFAEEESKALSVDEIVERTNRTSYYQGKDGRARVSMTITDAQKRVRKVLFTILRFDEPSPEAKEGQVEASEAEAYCGDQKFYVYFHLPADVNKMGFLVWKHLKKDDDRWLYLPGLDLIKRIAAADKRTSFVGSDFFYEDVSGRNINADVHELVKTGDTFYVLKNTPKKPEEVEFSYYIMWIHKQSFIPVKIEYFDAKDKIYRVYDAVEVKTIDGYPTVVKAKMTDVIGKKHTEIAYSAVKYNTGVPEDVFSERYLRRAPQEYLK